MGGGRRKSGISTLVKKFPLFLRLPFNPSKGLGQRPKAGAQNSGRHVIAFTTLLVRDTRMFLHACSILGQVDEFIGISRFIIVPRYQFVEARIEFYASASVKNTGSGVAHKIL